MVSGSISAQAALAILLAGDAPAGLTVSGVLDFSRRSNNALPSQLPENLTVDLLDFSGRGITSLPGGLSCYELNLSGTPIRSLPADLCVTSRLDLSDCEQLESLPEGLTVGTLILRGCVNLKRLPENLDVWFLDLSGCWAFDSWPRSAWIRGGRLQVRGCTALRSLPSYLHQLAALDVRDCPNLASLPSELFVSGWMDLAHSGLSKESSLPRSLGSTQIRWGGVNVDRRIAFRPEEIHVDEVLNEANAERRRVMLDRYGYGRFLLDSNAEILDQDVDPGGIRQLMRVKLKGDEDLVALSCCCPSTARQYIIRVPPSTPTCRHAAAWIAGFDDPDLYHPVKET